MIEFLVLVTWIGLGVGFAAVLTPEGTARLGWAPMAAVLGPLWLAIAAEQAPRGIHSSKPGPSSLGGGAAGRSGSDRNRNDAGPGNVVPMNNRVDKQWGFLTNHGHTLLALYRQPDLRQRDLARLVGITEGAIRRILTDLQQAGYVEAERVGRRNRYRVDPELALRHPLEADHSVAEVLEQLASGRGLGEESLDAAG